MKKIAYYLLILFFIASCRSYQPLSDLESGIVNGTVLDKTTNSGIPNATVYLLGNEGGGTWGGGGTASFLLDQTTSDAAGNFDFSFDYNNDYGYYCSAIAPQYFNFNEEIPVGDATFGANNVEVALQPIAYLQVHVKSINEYGPSDFISIQSVYDDPYYGSEVDRNIMLSVNGNSNYHLVWFIYIDGINDGSESIDIYCPSFDTTYYDLFY
jgi:hypothetical protein